MSEPTTALAKTPLYNLHIKHGARMVPFAGYSMPVQYVDGILKEHLHTRAAAGLFDVSHMGQVKLHGTDAAQSLEKLVPIDVIDLPLRQQRYAVFTNASGGILDDLMVTQCGDHLLLVVNATCKVDDIAHLRTQLPNTVQVEPMPNHALLALQGPAAREVLARLNPAASALKFMQTAALDIAGIPCWVSCSGYTGEDGYEISVTNEAAEDLALRLLAQPEVVLIGLGARDSLRLEAGLCLYGHDIDQSTTPVEANLVWSLSKARRPGGARAGNYFGAEIIERQLAEGVTRRRVLLRPQGKQPVREGAPIVNAVGENCGAITSGGFGPSVGAPVAMGYVKTAALQSELFALVRDKKIPLSVQTSAFIKQRYFR
ncbi:MAG TPA: glycine cleavage system aminomethyltransferase GcvT [Spongiibacteraceae bacterium]